MSFLELAEQFRKEAEAFKRNPPEAQWFSDPVARHEQRYWDGHGWTASVSDGGVQSEDPIDPGPESSEWLERFANPTLSAQRDEAIATSLGIPDGEAYRAIRKTMATKPEEHPDRVLGHYGDLVADEPDNGWLEGKDTTRRQLYAERIAAGTMAALAWCKKCDALNDVVPINDNILDLGSYRCSRCGHGVKDVRVVPKADVESVRAEFAALTPKEWRTAEKQAENDRSRHKMHNIDEWRARRQAVLEECRVRQEAARGQQAP